MNTIKIDKYFKGMVANRGLSGIETENTIFSFLAAANRSYFGISADLSVSKDNKIIITRDDTLLRLGLLNLYIPSFQYEELKKFALVDRKTTNLNPNLFIPLLSDFLAICSAYRKAVFIRLGKYMKPEHFDRIINDLNEIYKHDQVHILTDNRKHLNHLAKQLDANKLFLTVDKPDQDSFEFCKNHGFNLHIKAGHLTKDIVKDMHLFGLKVSTGVVNDKTLAEKLIKHDVDYVFTDILE
ncbi:MAG: hypothetical protein JXB08_01915 [Bacilli bacterium]|nr:hypothetical protein [Bacilli bacterium]MBN2876033.1 hypothetical protein [Bacilli bacterium]